MRKEEKVMVVDESQEGKEGKKYFFLIKKIFNSCYVLLQKVLIQFYTEFYFDCI